MHFKNAFNKLRSLDAYPKTLEDFRIKTYGGALVTVVSASLMVILFLSELNFYLTKEVHMELFVDISRGQKLRLNLDVTFPQIGCLFLTVDAMDMTGEQQIDVSHDIYKERLTADGSPVLSEQPEKEKVGGVKISTENTTTAAEVLDPNRCETCYGAEMPDRKCCNTCDELKEAYRLRGWALPNLDNFIQCKRDGWAEKLKAQNNEGCRIYGHVEVNKVAGNLHIAPGRSVQQQHMHVHDMHSFAGYKFNLSHHIRQFSFGVHYPGQFDPLDERIEFADQGNAVYQYFIKVVPTTYMNTKDEVTYTNQYSVTLNKKATVQTPFGESGLPGLFFNYELSPMMVKYTERHRSFMHFLTGVCAIVGGIFTVAGIIDAMIYHSSRALQRKIELGKAS